jgi:hypothetical protein
MIETILVESTSIVTLNYMTMQRSSLTVMPVSPSTGQPLYSPGAVRDVFTLAAMRDGGATAKEIRAAANSSVALYPVTKHCREDGKRGWCWRIYIDGQLKTVDANHGFSRAAFDLLPDSACIQLLDFKLAKRHNDSRGWS